MLLSFLSSPASSPSSERWCGGLGRGLLLLSMGVTVAAEGAIPAWSMSSIEVGSCCTVASGVLPTGPRGDLVDLDRPDLLDMLTPSS